MSFDFCWFPRGPILIEWESEGGYRWLIPVDRTVLHEVAHPSKPESNAQIWILGDPERGYLHLKEDYESAKARILTVLNSVCEAVGSCHGEVRHGGE